MRKNFSFFLLPIIILLALFFRLYNINWDQGHHLHPDERAIVMTVSSLKFPLNITEFFSPESQWNPKFFAYGSFPFYLLRFIGNIVGHFDASFAQYDNINLVGRVISALFDIGTIIFIFLIGKQIFNRTVGILGSLLYAISVLPIQLSHFYAVDTVLTFFIILTLYNLIRFYEKPTTKRSLILGCSFGIALATKISAAVLLAAIGAALIVDFLLIFIKAPHKPKHWFPHLPRFLKKLIADGCIIALATVASYIFLEPYAVIDFDNFLRQTIEQSHMTKSAFTFPYTLQYVGKIPYIYELKNIFFWGLGPVHAAFAFIGAVYFTLLAFKKDKSKKWAQEIIIATFFWTYFFVTGNFAIGFMRYMLPLYPLLCLFAAVLVYRLHQQIRRHIKTKLFFIFYFSFFILILSWPLSFMHIYTKPNTRVLASQWIYENIPPYKTLAREHWDDGLPIGGNIYYKPLELPIYEMENPLRENQIYQMVQQADYIIIASNRLYTPLQKISKNCQEWNLPREKCTHNANSYYKKLFSGELGYKKIAEFANYPTIPFLNIRINDQIADESFTVYDHPKVMIFQKQ